ncbi:Transglycosylase-associated protein [Thermosinus carboxydivorans Nor1]|uniref:Transglycosylase-associated protein n=1 Tax=Thermosinus carboxydivorans Nor1 TaxID=401526 RepID=A1HLT3_9FIRM|nr:GlsB/YeaQ/YmgE family stress response membrane protein [Thermosinus carboxydivorans]EAX48788.1 Transglycosylase-associated protein [Thermosinus carboxydivorans Nor1]
MLWFLVIGLVAGWLASQISRGSSFGLVGNLVVGIIGAYLGGLLFSLLGLAAYGTIGSIIMSTIGAIIFLWALRMVTGRTPAK